MVHNYLSRVERLLALRVEEQDELKRRTGGLLMMVRLDFTGRAASAARALRVAARPRAGVALLAEAGPRLPLRDAASRVVPRALDSLSQQTSLPRSTSCGA